MKEISGQSIIDSMAAGIEGFVKENLRDRLVKKLVEEFEVEITDLINEKLAEMCFKAHSSQNYESHQDQLYILIEWAKGQKEYTKKYSMVGEMVEGK